MKIAIVHSYYKSDSPSGENEVVDLQTQVLAEAGHEVKLVTVRTDHLDAGLLYGPRTALKVAFDRGLTPAATLSQYDPQIVICHNLFPNFTSRWLDEWAPRTIGYLHNFRTVCAAATLYRDGHDCQDCLVTGSHNAVKHRCYRGSAVASIPLAIRTRAGGRSTGLLGKAARLVVLNDRAFEVFAPIVGGERLRLLPNFVYPCEAQAPLSSDWVFVGRLTHEKGVVDLVNRWPSDRNLTIVGDGPQRDDVRRAIATNNLGGVVELTGILDRTATKQLISEAVGMVVPSRWAEGLPTVILEALARGCPLVVSDRVAYAATLEKHGGVRLFDVNDPASSLAAILDGVESERELLSKEAVVHHRDHFSPEVWVNEMNDLMAEVV